MSKSKSKAVPVPDGDLLLRMLVSQLPAILWSTDDDLRFTSSIGAGLARLNLRPEEVNGTTLEEFFQTKDHRFPPIAAHDRALRGETATFEQQWAGNCYESHVEPLRDDNGEIVGCVGVALDVTRRHEAERRAREGEARLRQLLDVAPLLVFAIDRTGQLLFVNRTAAQACGKPAEQLIGQDLAAVGLELGSVERKSPRSRARTNGHAKASSQDTSSPTQGFLTDAAGQRRRLSIVNIPYVVAGTTQEAVLYLASDASNVAESRATTSASTPATRALDSHILQSMINSISDGVVIADEQGKFLFFNPAAERIVGVGAIDHPPQEWPGDYGLFKSDTKTMFPADELPLVRAMQGETVAEVEIFIRNDKIPQGTWLSVNAAPLRDEHGTARGGVAVFRDISQHKQMDAKLRRKQELLRQLLDVNDRDRQLVAYEIHDGIVQQMTAANMHLQSIEGLCARDPARAEREIARAIDLTRQCVDEARRLIGGLRPLVLDEVGIVPAIETLVNDLRQVIPDVEFRHRTNFGRLAPALENMVFRIAQEALNNVRQHSQSQRALVELTSSGDRLRLSVQDWGVGFDPKQVSDERFGLQGIVQRARLMNSHAVIDSTPGQGTTILIDLPVVRK